MKASWKFVGQVALLLGAWAFNDAAMAAAFGPTPYLSAADSPFASLNFSYFYLEDFEDSALNTPGIAIAAMGPVVGPSNDTDSVDGDDGIVDGSGRAGHSLYTTPGSTGSSMAFHFDPAVLGGLPTHVGIVWTDVGRVTSGEDFSGLVVAEALGPDGLTSVGVIGPVLLGGDGSVAGLTAEDRFFGFSNPAGISRLSISMPNSIDWEVDHLQYGLIVPEPSYAILAGACTLFAAGGIFRSRRSLRNSK